MAFRSPFRIVLLLLVAAGLALRFVQFFANRSLWIDEAALALNVIHRSFASLLARLDYGQLAPVGFLWLEKATTELFGTGEAALRLVPLGAGVVALVLFARLSDAVLPPFGTLVAVGLFAVNYRLIYYSSEVKQYSTDVAVTVVLLTIGMALAREPFTWRRLATLAAVGTIAGWMSHPACFTLAGIGTSLIATACRRRQLRSLLFAATLGGWWTVSVLPVVIVARRNLWSEDLRYLEQYWSKGFPPEAAGPGEILRWMWTAFLNEHSYFFKPELPWRVAYVVTVLLILAMVLGGASLARRRIEAFFMIASPVALLVASSVVHVFPFNGRVNLFVLPFLVLLTGEGVGMLWNGVGRWGPALASTIGTLFLASLLARALALLPEFREELRPVLVEMLRKSRPGDSIYVYNGAVRAFRYYETRLGFANMHIIQGCCYRDQWPREVEALKRLGGRGRVWLVLSHWYGADSTFLPSVLDRFGRRLTTIQATGSVAYLYEMPPVDAGAVEAVLARVPPERNRSDPDWVCAGGILYDKACGRP